MTGKQVKIDREPQRDLLGDELSTPSEKPKYGLSSSRVFVAPDPHELFLSNQRVDAYLKQAGLTAPLKVAELLDGYDWSEFERRYADHGRPPYAPRAMVGLILYGTMQGISSLRGLEKFARADLGCLWISGGIFPDHASIGKFILVHHASFKGDLFAQITASALKATNSNGRCVAGDGTVVEASCSHYGQLHEEAVKANAEVKKKAADKEPKNKQLKAQAELAQKAEQHYEERKKTRITKGSSTKSLVINPVEPDAVVLPLKGKRGQAAAYKPSVLSNGSRVILAHGVDPTNEVSLIPGLIEQSQSASGDKVDTLMLDRGYCCNLVLELAIENDINLLCPGERVKASKKEDKKKFAKHQFKYDELNDVYVCPAGELLKPGPIGEKKYRMYSTPACKDCTQRAQCTTAKEGRRIRRLPGDELKEAQSQVMSHRSARKEFSQRQVMVEPVFGYLGGVQLLKRFKRRGLVGVQLEFAIHSSAYNLSRAVAALVAYFGFIFLLRGVMPGKNRDTNCLHYKTR